MNGTTEVGRRKADRAFPAVRFGMACGLTIVAFVVGCGEPPSGTVAGTAAFKGEPVFLGTIVFHCADGCIVSGNIHEGKFRVPNVPPGPAKISVQALRPAPWMGMPFDTQLAKKQATPPPPPPPRFVPLPVRYRDPATSELSREVQAGENPLKLDLLP